MAKQPSAENTAAAGRESRTGPAQGGAQTAADGTAQRPTPGQVKFDTSNLKSTYCNVCNGSSTREEVVLNFGVNSTWDLGRDQLEVALHHRIVMSPHAAKRVRDMMVRLIEEHEARHGKLEG